MPPAQLDRRALLCAVGLAVGTAAAGGVPLPAWARPPAAGRAEPQVLSGDDITLRIAHGSFPIDGRMARAVTINGTVPGPLLRLKEGQTLRLTVINDLDEETSLHWHGLLLPFQMDGVPGVSFPGIPARGRFTYEFPIVQSGTYWYHSHSGLQEMMGQYAPIVIEPAVANDGQAAVAAHDHVLLLSDHSFVHPARILRNLKADPGHYNRQPQTLAGLLGRREQSLAERLAWAKMRMDPTDIADATGAVLSYLVNGHGPAEAWTGLFTPGQPVRLRLINGAAMTFFNVRIPGLRLSVIAADGQDVRPVMVDELQIAPGETFDVLVTPDEDRAYGVVAESMDRSGMAFATLAPRAGMVAPRPALRARPLLTMKDMGMDMSAHDMADMAMGAMTMRDGANAPQVKLGPGVEMINPMPLDRTGEPGLGLDARYVGPDHRVLTYRDLVALAPNPDKRAPAREIEVHLTGAMDRYMWSMDGKVMSEAHESLALRSGERVRMTLINDTMMAHPIHLHGHYFELVTGHGEYSPRKHTVTVMPGGKLSWDVTAIPGDWPFHCHLFLHMAMGMMRVVQVRPV